MGIWMSRLMSYFGEKEARILVLGLDNAGKTTILCECRVNRSRLALASWAFEQVQVLRCCITKSGNMKEA
jgi:hypothetical protein